MLLASMIGISLFFFFGALWTKGPARFVMGFLGVCLVLTGVALQVNGPA